MTTYAKGRHAWGECQRSGKRVRYSDLVEDGHIPGLLVAPDWWEPEHPQETPPKVDDPVALHRPAPEISVPTNEGTAETTGGVTCAAEPDDDTYLATTVLAADWAIGSTLIPIETAAKYQMGQCIYVQRDDGTWFVSKSTSEAGTPAYTIPVLTGATAGAGVSTFSAGNDVYIGVTGGGRPIPLGVAELLDTSSVMQSSVDTNTQEFTEAITLPAGDDRMLIIPFMAVPTTHAVHGEEGEITATYGGVSMTVLATNRAEQMTTGVAVLAIEGEVFVGSNFVLDLGIDYGDFPTSVVEITAQAFTFGNVLQSDDDLAYDAVADNASGASITLTAVTPSRVGDLVFSFGVKKSLQDGLAYDGTDEGSYALESTESGLGDFKASSFCSGAGGRSAWSVSVTGAQAATWTQGSSTGIGALAFVMRAAS